MKTRDTVGGCCFRGRSLSAAECRPRVAVGEKFRQGIGQEYSIRTSCVKTSLTRSHGADDFYLGLTQGLDWIGRNAYCVSRANSGIRLASFLEGLQPKPYSMAVGTCQVQRTLLDHTVNTPSQAQPRAEPQRVLLGANVIRALSAAWVH